MPPSRFDAPFQLDIVRCWASKRRLRETSNQTAVRFEFLRNLAQLRRSPQ
jgi:hypothetical protein